MGFDDRAGWLSYYLPRPQVPRGPWDRILCCLPWPEVIRGHKHNASDFFVRENIAEVPHELHSDCFFPDGKLHHLKRACSLLSTPRAACGTHLREACLGLLSPSPDPDSARSFPGGDRGR